MPYQQQQQQQPAVAATTTAADADGVNLLLSLNKPRRRQLRIVSVTGEAMENTTRNDEFPHVPSSSLTSHRLCHSPIKIRSPEERQRENDAMWSPGVGQLLREASYGATSPSIREAAEALGQPHPDFLHERPHEDGDEEGSTQSSAPQKQRIISPSSSNEKSEESESKSWHRLYHQQAPWPRSYPHAHHHPNMYPPPPHFYMYPPIPPPPPPSFSSTISPYEQPAQKPKAELDWDCLSEGAQPRCVPLKQPLPTRSWGRECPETKLFEFARLVNFPHYLARGRDGKTTTTSVTAMDGKKHCVMCGKLRLCSAASARQQQESTATTHIIPRQNKGVCTSCDVAVWRILQVDVEIKWCKGCKNFRNWAAFGDKGLATKCVRCRKRQKEKYARQKSHT